MFVMSQNLLEIWVTCSVYPPRSKTILHCIHGSTLNDSHPHNRHPSWSQKRACRECMAWKNHDAYIWSQNPKVKNDHGRFLAHSRKLIGYWRFICVRLTERLNPRGLKTSTKFFQTPLSYTLFSSNLGLLAQQLLQRNHAHLLWPSSLGFFDGVVSFTSLACFTSSTSACQCRSLSHLYVCTKDSHQTKCLLQKLVQ